MVYTWHSLYQERSQDLFYLTSSPPQWYSRPGPCWTLGNIPAGEDRLRGGSQHHSHLVPCLGVQLSGPLLHYLVELLWGQIIVAWCCYYYSIMYLLSDNLIIHFLIFSAQLLPRQDSLYSPLTWRSRVPVSLWILLMMSETSMSVGLFPHLLTAAWQHMISARTEGRGLPVSCCMKSSHCPSRRP